MEKLFEREYRSEEEEKRVIETKIEIPTEDWQVFEIIAKRVGGNFGMEVRLGKPGEGSFFNPEDGSITLDPLHIKDDIEQAKFVTGHEGAHRAITPNPREIGLTDEQIKEYYSQIGFGYLQNVIEDPAVNDWMSGRFPGLKGYIDKFYDEQLKEDNKVLATPEVQQIAMWLGYWPRFSQFGSEIIRDWHQERFSIKLDPAVEKALQRGIKYARESIQTIPDPQKPTRDRKEIIETARKRFRKNTLFIWPEVKKLVEMDLHTEQQRQTLKDFRQKQQELEQKMKKMEDARKQGDTQKAEELKQEIDDLKQKLNPYNGLPEDVKKELQEQIDKAIKEAAEKLNREIEEKQKQAEQTKQRQKELEKELHDLKEKLKNASRKEELERQIQEKQVEKLTQEMKQKQAEEDLKNTQDRFGDIQSGKEIPYPEDKLSDEAKRELEKLFKKLPREKQKEIENKSRQTLEDFEDLINRELEGQLNEGKPENHKEYREREEIKRQAARKSQEAEKDRKRMEEELERIRREKMTPYERTRSEVFSLIDDLYYRLRRILKPEEYGDEELDWPSGRELDITRAMQAEKDPRQWNKAWIRESAPEKRDYRFWHLVDLSASMKGNKIKETLKGFIVACEAIDRIENLNSDTLTVHQGITGFHNRVFSFKEMKERINKEVEDRLAAIEQRTQDKDAGTNTYAGTIKALEKLEQNLGESGNYLLTFSDGQPNYDIREELKKTLQGGKERRKKLGIRVGLIWLGESESKEELQKLVKEYGYDFGLVMPAVDSEDKEKKDSFAEKLAVLMEELVKYPEKY